MTALNKEHLTDVVGNSSKELYNNLQFLTSQYFTLHYAAFNESRSADRAQINTEFKWHFPDILDEEIASWTLVVCYFTEVNLFGWQAISY